MTYGTMRLGVVRVPYPTGSEPTTSLFLQIIYTSFITKKDLWTRSMLHVQYLKFWGVFQTFGSKGLNQSLDT